MRAHLEEDLESCGIREPSIGLPLHIQLSYRYLFQLHTRTLWSVYALLGACPTLASTHLCATSDSCRGSDT